MPLLVQPEETMVSLDVQAYLSDLLEKTSTRQPKLTRLKENIAITITITMILRTLPCVSNGLRRGDLAHGSCSFTDPNRHGQFPSRT
jgi:hypothetical protein